MQTMTVTELAARLSAAEAPLLLDVREAWELDTARIEPSTHVPMAEVPDRLEELRAAQGERDLVVMCHSGVRSRQIASFLNQNGFQQVWNLSGGIDAWSREVDPAVPRY